MAVVGELEAAPGGLDEDVGAFDFGVVVLEPEANRELAALQPPRHQERALAVFAPVAIDRRDGLAQEIAGLELDPAARRSSPDRVTMLITPQ